MIDYYEELELDRNLGLKELQYQIDKVHSFWSRRLDRNATAEAQEKLLRCTEAREIFKDEDSRAEYDRELAESKKPKKQEHADPNAERRASYEKWKADASRYAKAGQWDLAEQAVGWAFRYGGSDDPEMQAIAANVFKENRKYTTALYHINNAIVLDPDVARFDLLKAQILDSAGNAAQQGKKNDFYRRAVDAAQSAIEKAKRTGDKQTEGASYGILASVKWFRLNDHSLDTYTLAQQAATLTGDSDWQAIVDQWEWEREAEKAAAARAEAERKAAIKREEQRKREEKEAHERAAAYYKAKKEKEEREEAAKARVKGWNIFRTVASVACVLQAFALLSANEMSGFVVLMFGFGLRTIFDDKYAGATGAMIALSVLFAIVIWAETFWPPHYEIFGGALLSYFIGMIVDVFCRKAFSSTN